MGSHRVPGPARAGRAALAVLALAFGLAPAARAADPIATFDDGPPPLTSYPGQDTQPTAWSLVTGQGGAGSALQLTGDTWKVLAIPGRALGDSTVWSVACNAVSKGGTQAIGFGDGSHELFYTIAGRDLPTATNWWTVYQGAFALNAWHDYVLPVGRDWLTAFGSEAVIDRVFFVSEAGNGSAGTTRFDTLADVTLDRPRAPRVNILYTIDSQRKLRAGEWDVTAHFSATVFDPDSGTFTWRWDFGDGQTSALPDPVHTFTVTATHPWTVGLVVRDDSGLAGGDTCRVAVHEGPGDGRLTVNFVGDVFTGRGYETSGGIIDTQGIGALFTPTLPIFGQAADVNVCNLEVSYTDRGTPHPTKSVVFRSEPQNIAGLTIAGVDLVTVGNNHIIDYGEIGMLDTMAGLDGLGIPYCGAGSNETFALQPAFWSQNGVRLGFLGLCNRTGREWNYQPFLDAGRDKPGFAYLLPPNVASAIAATRPQADLVIVQSHSGTEYAQAIPEAAGATAGFDVEAVDKADTAPEFHFLNEPTPSERDLRHQVLDAGADVLINHHPHVLQGFESYHGKLIAHSLGNFVFDLGYVETMPSGVLTLEIAPGAITGYRFTPAFIDHWIPRPATGNLGREILGWLADQSRPQNVVMAVDPNAAPAPQARLWLSRADVDSTVTPLALDFLPVEQGGYVTSPPLRLPDDAFLSSVAAVNGGGGSGWEVAWGRELLWHTGFEDEGAAFWDVNTDDESIVTDASHGGARSLQIKRSQGQVGQTGTDLILHLACRGDRRHSAEGWLRAENTAQARIAVRFYSSRSTETTLADLDLAARFTGTTDWVRQWKDLTTPSTATWFELRCGVEPPAAGTGKAWFDDLALVEWEPWQPLTGDALKVPVPHNYRYLQVRRAGALPEPGQVVCGLTTYGSAASAVPPGGADDGSLPRAAVLALACQPNPFNPRTTIELALGGAAGHAVAVRVDVYDLAGRRVRALYAGPLEAGRRHGLSWDGADDAGRPLASGVYVCRAVAGDQAQALKVTLVR